MVIAIREISGLISVISAFRLAPRLDVVENRLTEPMKSLLDRSAAVAVIRLISAPTLLRKLFKKTTSLSVVKTRERRLLKAKQLSRCEQNFVLDTRVCLPCC